MALDLSPEFLKGPLGPSVRPGPGLRPGQVRLRECHVAATASVTGESFTSRSPPVTSRWPPVTSDSSLVTSRSSRVTSTSWAAPGSFSTPGSGKGCITRAERIAAGNGAISEEPAPAGVGRAEAEESISATSDEIASERKGPNAHKANGANSANSANSDEIASETEGPNAHEAHDSCATEQAAANGFGEGTGEGREEGDVDYRGNATWTNKYLLVIAYDGTCFAGWQRQPGKETVQSNVEHALAKVTRQPLDKLGLMVSGRTDAGVHAHGQAAHFVTDAPLPNVRRTFIAVNSVLPRTIRIRRLLSVPRDFHARYSTTSKVYHYTVHNATAHDVFTARTSLWVNMVRLDRGAMQTGARHFVGTHDFSAFANASVVKERDAVRHIFRFDLVELDDFTFRFEVEGSGFLYKQVRNMVGLLLKIGRRELPPDIVPVMLASRSREELALLATCAKPQGLALHAVNYPSHFFMDCHDANLCQGLSLPSLNETESFKDLLQSKKIHS